MTPMFAMSVDPWILAFSAITVGATIFMGFWTARKSKTASDFFVAGRSVSVGWNASAISGEYLSAASFMGIAGMVMSSGYDALWYPVCYACGYLFLLLFIAGPLRRFGAYTIPDFAEGRFDSPVFRKIAVCFVLFIGFFYTMPQMKGAGTTLAYIFPGLPYWAGVVLVGAVITLNVALGGMKGITLVQAVQYWVKMFAISVPIFVLVAVYGSYGEQLEVNAQKQTKTKRDSDRFVSAPVVFMNVQAAKLPKIDSFQNARHWFDVKKAQFEKRYQPCTNAQMTVYGALSHISAYTGEKFVVSADIQDSSIVLTFTNALNEFEFQDLLTSGILSKQLVFVPDPALATQVVSISNTMAVVAETVPAGIMRKPLPEKAPADSTWLSPFGPLTTKAAKAAKPEVSYTGALSNSTNGSLRELFADGFLMMRGRGSSKAHSIDPDDYTLSEFSRMYAQCVLLSERTTDVVFSVQCAPAIADKKVAWTNGSSMPVGELAKKVEKAFADNGLVVIREQGNLFKVVPTRDAVIKPIDPRPYSLLYTYSLIIALVCGTAGLPHILVRFYTNPDGVAAKRTTMWVMILIGIFYVFPPVFGVMGRNLFPELYSGIGAKGTDKIVLELPRLLNEKYAPLGSILSGITCAGAFAAFMSTFSGLLVSMTGAMAHDVYGRMLRPKSTPNERMRMFKVFAVVLGGVAMLLGSFVEPLEINFMVGQAFAIAAASYFPLLFMAVWWRKLTMKGAATGMLVGGLSAVVAISLTSFSVLALAPGPSGELFAIFKPLNTFWAGHPLLRILCEQPAIWAVPLAIGLMIVVSKLTRDEVPSDIRMKMLVLHAPEKLGLKQEYIQEHQPGGH